MPTLETLSEVPMEDRLDILRKNWVSLDARWQFAAFTELGIEKGNQINQEVARQSGKTMMYRMMTALGYDRIDNIGEFYQIWKTAMDFYWPPPRFEYALKQDGIRTFKLTVTRCFTSENVKKVGIEEVYECGCRGMREGWFEAMGVSAEQEINKSLKDGDPHCEICIILKSIGNI